MLGEAQAPIERLEESYVDAAKLYLSDVGRTLGFLSYSPHLGFSLGVHKYTEDVAVIEVDAAKIDPRTFRPNVLDMGSELNMADVMDMLDPRRGWHQEDPSPLQLPVDVLLPLRDIIPDAELREPTQKDFNGDPCIMVLKRGKASGLTAGRLNNVPSYTRTFWEDGTSDVSMEWPVFGYRYSKLGKQVPFSEPGDSGAVVVDGQGRIAGIITGGAGFVHPTLDPTETPTAHVTYITAADFIRDQMRTRGIDMNVNFTLPVD